MAVRRHDLRIRDVAVVVDQRLDDLARARGGEPPVRGERNDEKPALRRRERLRQISARRERRIEIVERLGDAQVGVRVEILGELLALVAQVRLDLELRRERELQPVAQRAAEFLLHLLVGEVGDVADHPRHDEAAPRLRALRLEVAVVKIRVREDRLPRDLVERDVLRGQVRRGGDHQRVPDAVGVARRPGERLHAAEAPAHDGGPLANAEEVGEPRLRVHPVLDRDEREVGAPGFPGRRIRRQRPGRAEAAAEIVDPDDEEAVGVERLARADHVVPPADVVGLLRVVAGHVVRCIERVADEHGIGAVGIERAVRLVGEFELRQRPAAGERQRRVEARPARDDGADRASRRGARGTSSGRRGKRRHRVPTR